MAQYRLSLTKELFECKALLQDSKKEASELRQSWGEKMGQGLAMSEALEHRYSGKERYTFVIADLPERDEKQRGR